MSRVRGGDGIPDLMGPGPDPLPTELTVVRRHPGLDRPERWLRTPTPTEIVRPPPGCEHQRSLLVLAVAALSMSWLIIALSVAIAAASLLPL